MKISLLKNTIMRFRSTNNNIEGNQESGTYVNIEFSDDTKDRLVKFMKLNRIPNPVERDDLHSTLLVSMKSLPHSGQRDIHWEATPIAVKKTKTQTGDDAIVIHYFCPEQRQRHHELIDKHQTEHSFPDYYIHVTLSYASKGFDLSNVRDFESLGKLIITKEVANKNVLVRNDIPMNTAPVKANKILSAAKYLKKRTALGCP